LEGFDTNYKLLPPLRTNEDNNALLKGLKEGTIDGLTSDHNPIDIEHKKTEFDHALFGSIGLESCFGAINALLGFEESVKALTALKNTFNIPSQEIEEGNQATLTLFNPDGDWLFSEKDIISTSKNAALLGTNLKGNPYGIIANNQLVLNK
jgi:dihydroorotase